MPYLKVFKNMCLIRGVWPCFMTKIEVKGILFYRLQLKEIDK